MSVFVDSSVFIAFYSKRDERHDDAAALVKRIFEGEFGAVFTSDYVFNECVNFLLAKTKNAAAAVECGEKLLGSELNLLRVSSSAFGESWSLFKKYGVLSFTDCTNVQLMKEQGIRKLASFDKGFKSVKEIELV